MRAPMCLLASVCVSTYRALFSSVILHVYPYSVHRCRSCSPCTNFLLDSFSLSLLLSLSLRGCLCECECAWVFRWALLCFCIHVLCTHKRFYAPMPKTDMRLFVIPFLSIPRTNCVQLFKCTQ